MNTVAGPGTHYVLYEDRDSDGEENNTHEFRFNTPEERDAFIVGVEWVADSAITLLAKGERE